MSTIDSTLITIILGSKSDQPVADKVTAVLHDFQVNYSIHVASAHRTPELVMKIVLDSTASVFITIAGLSAALPGVVAAHTIRPVIGVPISGKINLDSILSIIQMPPGIPVAAVGLDNGSNAALLAIAILAISNKDLAKKLENYRKKARAKIIEANNDMN
jgi:5-(carboxyamino)imidazole ribonucleotide mutase